MKNTFFFFFLTWQHNSNGPTFLLWRAVPAQKKKVNLSEHFNINETIQQHSKKVFFSLIVAVCTFTQTVAFHIWKVLAKTKKKKPTTDEKLVGLWHLWLHTPIQGWRKQVFWYYRNAYEKIDPEKEAAFLQASDSFEVFGWDVRQELLFWWFFGGTKQWLIHFSSVIKKWLDNNNVPSLWQWIRFQTGY